MHVSSKSDILGGYEVSTTYMLKEKEYGSELLLGVGYLEGNHFSTSGVKIL